MRSGRKKDGFAWAASVAAVAAMSMIFVLFMVRIIAYFSCYLADGVDGWNC
jgi:hypothetical protein